MDDSYKVKFRHVRIVRPLETVTNGVDCTHLTALGHGKNFTYGTFDAMSENADESLQKAGVNRADFASYYDEDESEEVQLKHAELFLKVMPYWFSNLGPKGTSLEGLELSVDYLHTDMAEIVQLAKAYKHVLSHIKLYLNVYAYSQDTHAMVGLFPPLDIKRFCPIVYSSKACMRIINCIDGMT